MTAGKGSKQRPQQVPDEQVADSWNTIFRPLCTDCGKRECDCKEAEKSASSLLEDQKNEN